ncbi:hypothetical protein [Ancylobacter sp. IITR112]|uniref:hypothetical protein n=1 Tax=Ancylobacter sp. IITR112 TaxID=3138073 RepID=UPI00352B408A
MAASGDTTPERDPAAKGDEAAASGCGAPPNPRRRAALAKLGRAAAYGVPVTLGLMMMPRSARAS